MDRGAMFLSFFARLARLRTGPAPAVEGLLFIAGLWPSERHLEPLVHSKRSQNGDHGITIVFFGYWIGIMATRFLPYHFLRLLNIVLARLIWLVFTSLMAACASVHMT